MVNYFNTLNLRNKLKNLSKCRLMQAKEFSNAIQFLINKKIVIIGCGAQGLNQGLNMRDSGLNIAYVLRKDTIQEKSMSFCRAIENSFQIGSYEELIPSADLVINLTPDKQHAKVIEEVQKLMKYGAILGYSHGFNIVELGTKIRKDITVILVAPKSPGTEVREEYQKGFGVPTLIAVHQENDPQGIGLITAKAWAVSLGSDRAGVLESSFVAEVKSDLIGEQTILCGMLQTGSLLFFNRLLDKGYPIDYSSHLIQFGWETITNSLKLGGITLMMHRLSNAAKLRAYFLSEKLKKILTPLFEEHVDNIISGQFSETMMYDWANGDKKLMYWREKTKTSAFENSPDSNLVLKEQDYYDQGLILVAFIKAGVELAFETMIDVGISAESAYYESLHELPLIANLIARKRLYEMNLVISDTAEYGNYLFSSKAVTLLQNFISTLQPDDLGTVIQKTSVDNSTLLKINNLIHDHPIESIGYKLRGHMNRIKK